MSKVIYEGWMVRYGRRKIGRSFIHMRYFVLESRVLAYYKRKPQDNVVPIKTLHIDGNCRVEDRGLKTQHGRSVYALSIYNKKDKYHGIKMAAFNIQETQSWKEKIQAVIDQQEELFFPSGNQASPFEYKPGVDNGRTASSSDHDSQYSEQEDEGNRRILLRRTTIGNGPPDSVFDWTRDVDSELTNSYSDDQVFHKKHWRLVRCQNGLRIFEELLEMDYLPRSCSRAMKAVGVIEATCSEIFELLMSTDGPRFEWDCCFQYGRVVKEVDGHTAILYQRLQLDWFPLFVWPRDLCYVRYWRRNDDGSYVVLFRSTEHENWGPQPGYVRAHVESGGFIISPLKSSKGRSRSKVQHLMQIDLKGWGVGYFPSFKQHSLFQMLNSVAGLREWFAQTDGSRTVPRIPMIVKMASDIVSSEKGGNKSKQLTLQREASRQFGTPDDESDEDDEFQFAETTEQENGFTDFEHEANKSALDEEAEDELDFSGLSGNLRYNERDGNQDCWRISDGKNFRVRSRQFLFEKTKKGFAEALDEEPEDKLDLSGLSGNLRYDERDGSRDCWRISDGNNFRVRSRQFLFDKTKIPAGKHLMNLAAVDWFKDTRRMDHVARRKGCAVHVASERGLFTLVFNLQVPGSTHYSMVFYFVSRKLEPGSLLQRFVDGDDEFRNSRMKLIPSVPKGSWIVRQSVGSTPCLLGKAVDCNYIRGPNYLEIDVDIGSSTVANGVLGLVCGVITTLVVDMAFLVQANTLDELPERLIGAVRVSHVELSSAVVPVLDATPIVE